MCDNLIVNTIYPVVKSLKRSKVINRWFFIRYFDPEFHLRFRLELSDTDNLPIVLKAINKRLLPLCHNHQLHKLMIDTYEREIERYGERTMDVTETFFDIDSHCACLLLKHLMSNGRGAERWKLAFVWIDAILDAIGLDLEQKWNLIQKTSNSFLDEFGFNEHNIKTLSSRYRNIKTTIEQLLPEGFDELSNKLIKIHSERIKKSVRDVEVSELNQPSLLHMTINRLFASQNRQNEMMLYYCLERYYRSKIKREQQCKIQLEE